MRSVTGHEKENITSTKYNQCGTPCAADLLESLSSSTARIPHSLRKREIYSSPDPEVSREKSLHVGIGRP